MTNHNNSYAQGTINSATTLEVQTMLPTFDANFLAHHAGSLLSEPRYAIIELVANCWDAGADEVKITWPKRQGDSLIVEDNGIGMTRTEFQTRWTQLNYDRLKHQGLQVEFPPDVRHRPRTPFGRNGVGRHAMFCFADEYWIETTKAGLKNRIHVKRSFGGDTPFSIRPEPEQQILAHSGTKIYTIAEQHILSRSDVVTLIGSRFIADPEFNIYVDDELVSLTDFGSLVNSFSLSVEGVGEIPIRRYDTTIFGKTGKLNGVAWWVNHRLVGTPSWDVFDGPLLDSRFAVARRYIYVVEANILALNVKHDWSGFYVSSSVNKVRRDVNDYIRSDLRTLMWDIRKERKVAALKASRTTIKNLPLISQEHVAQFAEEIQVRSPTMAPRDLDNAVEVLAKLEEARSGYVLLEKLSQLSGTDLDELDAILEAWNVNDVRRVLDELQYRLRLIDKLEHLVENPSTDELHELQPLFDRGLWIFGPEFESISFISNRTLREVVRQLFDHGTLTIPRNRPDFIALPDGSIGLYACDSFDERSEVSGYATVVIVELKRGGLTISHEQKGQALQYARELRQTGKVTKATRIVCYVLGTSVDPAAEDPLNEGNSTVLARTYNIVLRQAHARTFQLYNKIHFSKAVQYDDKDLEAVITRFNLEIELNAFEE